MAASVGGSQWDDFEFTRDEVNNIKEALKKEEFRKLLVEYVEEVSDPENRKKYQEEVTLLEKERGYDVTFVNPEPGYVIKTSVDGQKKTFINVCKSDKVGKPTSVPTTKAGSRGLTWSLPYTPIQPRDDLDKSGKRCVIYDVVFHPDTLRLSENNKPFKNMLDNTALDAIENTYNVKLDRKNLKFPKLKYKGGVSNSVFRKKNDYKVDEKIVEEMQKLNYPFFNKPKVEDNINTCNNKKNNNYVKPKMDPNVDTPYTTPKYTIKHRSSVEMQDYVNDKTAKINATIPKELVVEIELPLLRSSNNVALDVTEKSISLKSEKQARYKLDIELPYHVDENMGSAKFDAKLRKLFVTLPVLIQKNNLVDGSRYDSGVESDLGQRTPESTSSDEDSGENCVLEPPISVESDACDVVRTEVLPDVNGGEVIRTNNVDMFLDPDKHYTLPSFTCNVFDEVFAFTLHVKNVDPTSVKHCFLGDNSQGIHIKFTSMGSGFFPVHHAFCVKFPPEHVLDQECLNIETWDNNVIVQIQLKACDTSLTEYYVGLDETSAIKHDLLEPAVLGKKADHLKETSENDHMINDDVDVRVTKATKEEFEIEISSKSNEYVSSSNLESIANLTLSDSDKKTDADESLVTHGREPMLDKCRTLSESSGDEVCTSPTKKGILKNKGRVFRSLSESNADDYTWSSSLDAMGPSGGSDSCIPEEDEGDIEHKKTVRFNDVISQKIYRNNSSILGQRKKNQKRTRNKKRAQERRASESEASEGELEKDKDKDYPEENHVDDEVTPAYKSGPSGNQTIKNENNAVPHVDLKNDLIFSLEM